MSRASTKGEVMRPANRFIVTIAILGAALLAAGCDASEAKPSAGVPKTEGSLQQLRKVGKETNEAAQATKDYAYAVRAEFVKDMQNELRTINRTLQQLSDKVQSGSNSAKADAKAKLIALRNKAAQLNVEIEKAKNAPEAAWDQVKAGVKKSHDDLKESVAQARTWLSEKIAP
jgi:predicted  nucleic acid-binding Zn-ribbon protein